MTPIKVGLLDRNFQRRTDLEQVLGREPGMLLGASGGTLPWLLSKMATQPVDIVLLARSECRMPLVHAVAKIQNSFPAVRCLVRCEVEIGQVRLALRGGAWGAVDAGADIPEVLRAVRAVARGTCYGSQKTTMALIKDIVKHHGHALLTELGNNGSVSELERYGAQTAEELEKLLAITGLPAIASSGGRHLSS